MALGRQIVYLVGAHLANHLQQAHRIAQVGVMQMKMRLAFQMGNPFPEIDRGTAYRPVDIITFLQQELGQERTILPRDASNQSCLSHVCKLR